VNTRAVALVVVGCLAAAAVWAAIVACPRPEEDACSSTGDTVLFVAILGMFASLVVLTLVAVVIFAVRLTRRVRSEGNDDENTAS